VSTVSCRIFLVPKLPTSHPPRLHLLVPQGGNRGNGDGASEIISRELSGL
jgi:hypothetical protein